MTSLVLGILVNQWHPRGIGIKNLLWNNFFGSEKTESAVQIISVDSAFALLKEPHTAFLDLRSLDDYQLDHIPGAIYVSRNELLRGTGKAFSIPKRDKIIIYDQEGDLNQLKLASQIFARVGFNQIFLLFGGYVQWLEKGMDIESPSDAHE